MFGMNHEPLLDLEEDLTSSAAGKLHDLLANKRSNKNPHT
jgi:hypothetical protein